MQVNKIYYPLLVFFVLLQGCSSGLTSEEYVQWVKDYEHGLHRNKAVDQLIFDVQYCPAVYRAMQEASLPADHEKLLQRAEALKGLEYYILKISKEGPDKDFIKSGIESEKEFYDRLYYYSFNFQKDIYLEADGHTIPCHLFHFERSYDLRKERTFVLAFKSTDQTGDRALVINSPVLGLGPVKLLFEKKDLNSIPQLKL